jgi:hypothetical protein
MGESLSVNSVREKKGKVNGIVNFKEILCMFTCST